MSNPNIKLIVDNENKPTVEWVGGLFVETKKAKDKYASVINDGREWQGNERLFKPMFVCFSYESQQTAHAKGKSRALKILETLSTEQVIKHSAREFEYRNLQPRTRTRFGKTIHSAETTNEFNAYVVKGESIRIFGIYRNHVGGAQHFDLTFRIGSEAEFHSYNLIYTGKIVAISEKTVTIADERAKHQLWLYDFANKNWDFDSERIAKHNLETSYYI